MYSPPSPPTALSYTFGELHGVLSPVAVLTPTSLWSWDKCKALPCASWWDKSSPMYLLSLPDPDWQVSGHPPWPLSPGILHLATTLPSPPPLWYPAETPRQPCSGPHHSLPPLAQSPPPPMTTISDYQWLMCCTHNINYFVKEFKDHNAERLFHPRIRMARPNRWGIWSGHKNLLST